MSDSPPPAYSQLLDDPFVDSPSLPASTQPYDFQIDYRALHNYGPEIPVPEDFTMPHGRPVSGKYYVVPVGQDIAITDIWGVANSLIVQVPGGNVKGFKAWNDAIKYYTECYKDGSVKIVYLCDTSSTPGCAASNALHVHSAAPTPTRGVRGHPIHVTSSPAAVHVHSAPTPTRGIRGYPIQVTSSPAAARVVTTPDVAHRTNIANTPTPTSRTCTIPSTPSRAATATTPSTPSRANMATPPSTPSDDKIKCNLIIDRLFDNLAHKSATATTSVASASPIAAWQDPTPVSIPLAAVYSRTATGLNMDGHDTTPPSTPYQVANAILQSRAATGSNMDGRDTTLPSTPYQVANMILQSHAAMGSNMDGWDDTSPSTPSSKVTGMPLQSKASRDLFDDFPELTVEELISAFELEKALMSPRFA